MRPPPPPPLRSGFGPATASNASSLIGTGPSVNPAFVKSMNQLSMPQLQQLARQLKMEVLIARFMGNPAAAELAQAKLSLVDGKLGQLRAEAKAHAQLEGAAKGMTGEQLEAARSAATLQLFSSFLRGDEAGVRSAQDQVKVIDAELARRESELTKFGEELCGMSEDELSEVGEQLAMELFKLLFAPTAQASQKDNAFNRFGVLLAEQLQRGVVSSANDWLFSK
jgi:hypothetical protein